MARHISLQRSFTGTNTGMAQVWRGGGVSTGGGGADHYGHVYYYSRKRRG